MVWTRGGRDDYDEWEALGNPGWGWDGLLPYFKKVLHAHSAASTCHTKDYKFLVRDLYASCF